MTVISATRSTSTAKWRDAFGENEAGEVVALRILLPVDEVTGGLDVQRVGEDRRAAVGRGAQANDLRGKA